MDCCSNAIDPEGAAINKAISAKIDKENYSKPPVTKLLLLGAGESGKSTVAKQLKIIHLQGFSSEERESYIDDIHINTYQSMRALIEACKEFDIKIDPKHDERILQFQKEYFDRIGPSLAKDIIELWKEDSIQQAYRRRNEFQLSDSAEYYCTEVERISQANYVPTDQDILRVRIRTTGVTETQFTAEGHHFLLVDVGGQRSERKKWIHCFEGITACLFCVALSGYDQTLFEDRKTNRMLEALKLFHEVCTSKWFTNTAIMLFLNKSDLFREKLEAGKSIKCCFPDYEGPTNFDESVEFIQDRFTNITDPMSKRPIHIYPHITCATSTENVKVVFESVRDFIIHQLLQTATGAGF